jgi:hypothetical protein
MLTGFTAGLLLITLSELGDKTFFIGAILAMRHPRRWVFLGGDLGPGSHDRIVRRIGASGHFAAPALC